MFNILTLWLSNRNNLINFQADVDLESFLHAYLIYLVRHYVIIIIIINYYFYYYVMILLNRY